jgi:hypothetical protein
MMAFIPTTALTITTGASLLVLGIIAYYCISWIRSWHRLSHIPGPRGWGWTIFPWLRLHTRTDLFDQFYNLTARYGPLVRVGPNTLICSDAEVMRRL